MRQFCRQQGRGSNDDDDDDDGHAFQVHTKSLCDTQWCNHELMGLDGFGAGPDLLFEAAMLRIGLPVLLFATIINPAVERLIQHVDLGSVVKPRDWSSIRSNLLFPFATASPFLH